MKPTRPKYALRNPAKASSTQLGANQIHIGKVVRASGGIFVNVPTLAPNQNFGPCQVFTKRPRVGDLVMVGFVEGRTASLSVIGTAHLNHRIVQLDDPVDPQDAATKKYVDDKIADLLAKLLAKSAGYVLDYAAPDHTHPEYASSGHNH